MAFKSLTTLASIGASLPAIDSFAPPSIAITRHQSLAITRHQSLASSTKRSKIIDAEFISNESNSNDSSSKETMSLIEYSQQGDTDWKSMPIAFCDVHSNTYIDCTLAFYVKDSETGEEYALGVPCETPVVVCLELEESLQEAASGANESAEEGVLANLGTVLPINPDSETGLPSSSEGYSISEEAKEEIFQIAAKALMEEYGQGIRLKKTPRVLTVQGDLDSAIGDWKSVLMGSVGGGKMNRLSMEEAMEIVDQDEKEGEEFFDMVMKRDLGEDYMDLLDDDEEEEIDEEILKAFEGLAGVDEEEGDVQDFLQLIKDMASSEENEAVKEAKDFNEGILQRLKPSAALKLLSFIGPDGDNVYTILRPLRPLLLVGKEDPEDFTRRILLSEDEKREVLPKLERVCREELEEAGFFLSGGSEQKK